MQLIHTLVVLFLSTTAFAKCCVKAKCTYYAWDGKKQVCQMWECKRRDAGVPVRLLRLPQVQYLLLQL
jgi:hypothetical protein